MAMMMEVTTKGASANSQNVNEPTERNNSYTRTGRVLCLCVYAGKYERGKEKKKMLRSCVYKPAAVREITEKRVCYYYSREKLFSKVARDTWGLTAAVWHPPPPPNVYIVGPIHTHTPAVSGV